MQSSQNVRPFRNLSGPHPYFVITFRLLFTRWGIVIGLVNPPDKYIGTGGPMMDMSQRNVLLGLGVSSVLAARHFYRAKQLWPFRIAVLTAWPSIGVAIMQTVIGNTNEKNVSAKCWHVIPCVAYWHVVEGTPNWNFSCSQKENF